MEVSYCLQSLTHIKGFFLFFVFLFYRETGAVDRSHDIMMEIDRQAVGDCNTVRFQDKLVRAGSQLAKTAVMTSHTTAHFVVLQSPVWQLRESPSAELPPLQVLPLLAVPGTADAVCGGDKAQLNMAWSDDLHRYLPVCMSAAGVSRTDSPEIKGLRVWMTCMIVSFQ